MSLERNIKFCKETKLTKDGLETFYFTRDNGELVSGSLSITEHAAREFFETYVELGGKISKEEILEEVEI
jgi:hypothetical protein